jgi:hypothetical protein
MISVQKERTGARACVRPLNRDHLTMAETAWI